MDEGGIIKLDLSVDEFQLVQTALKLLLSTLGHEEAEELEQVRSLLGKLDLSGV